VIVTSQVLQRIVPSASAERHNLLVLSEPAKDRSVLCDLILVEWSVVPQSGLAAEKLSLLNVLVICGMANVEVSVEVQRECRRF